MNEQARGNYKSREIACVMERRFFDDPRNARARSGAAEQPTGEQEEKFKVAAGDCDLLGAIWWTRRGVCDRGGGATGIGPGPSVCATGRWKELNGSPPRNYNSHFFRRSVGVGVGVRLLFSGPARGSLCFFLPPRRGDPIQSSRLACRDASRGVSCVVPCLSVREFRPRTIF